MRDDTQGYYSNHGPLDGLFSANGEAEDIPVFDSFDCKGEPIGFAHPVGWIRQCNLPVRLYRITVHSEPPSGLWVCDRRTFMRLSERPEMRPDPEAFVPST